MSCCGNKRNEYVGNLSSSTNNPASALPPKMWNDELFEYTGDTALLVTGSITGKKYQFENKGNIQLVDYRDVKAMMRLAELKKVK